VARLTWNQSGPNRYEHGVDHGVVYDSSGLGHVWNGLLNVEATVDDASSTPYYFDGVKYMDQVGYTNYQAEISAFSVPYELEGAVGDRSVVPGFILTRQPRTRFSLCYRTLIEPGLGYKLHLIYNAIASRQSRGYSTIEETGSAIEFSWTIDTVPLPSSTYRPSSYFVLESPNILPESMTEIENILYGSDTESARLISIDELELIINGPLSERE